jgi:hypothetical protein
MRSEITCCASSHTGSANPEPRIYLTGNPAGGVSGSQTVTATRACNKRPPSVPPRLTEMSLRRQPSGKTSRDPVAVATNLPLASVTVPSAKATRLPAFDTTPTQVNGPLPARIERR